MEDIAPAAAAGSPATRSRRARRLPAGVALGALGIVFGDIGTSPLYAFKQVFLGPHAPAPSAENILGVLSLILWTIVAVVAIKYATFVLRADHQGEGGTLAMLALLTRGVKYSASVPAIGLVILFGTATLYGDGIITPAISVLSAIEGLGVATSALTPLVVPVTVLILIGLFALQPRGTGKIGALFGPVMLLWFLTIGIFGALSVASDPRVLAALNPWHALQFFLRGGPHSVLVMGAVVLCVSGVEALYADLAHFGIGPIRWAWYGVVLPALVLNYFGQGAVVLRVPAALATPFWSTVPGWAAMPAVVLATAATVIASQALISGAFSLTQQAMQLGFTPRMTVRHTSRRAHGQIYVPTVNGMLAVACIILVLTFRSSERLADAYGLAVTVAMLADTIGFAAIAHAIWRWPRWRIAPLVTLFAAFDLSFLAGNVPKLLSGGWIPLTIGVVLFTLFMTWYSCRRRHGRALAKLELPVESFLAEIDRREPQRMRGTAVFTTGHPEGIPYALGHHWLRTHVIYETIVLLTIAIERQPYVAREQRVEVNEIRRGVLYRVVAHYGFIQMPDVGEIWDCARAIESDHDFRDATYYVADPTIVRATGAKRMRGWQRSIYAFMLRLSRPITAALEIAPECVVKVGVEIAI